MTYVTYISDERNILYIITTLKICMDVTSMQLTTSVTEGSFAYWYTNSVLLYL